MRIDARAGNRKQKKHSYLERFDKFTAHSPRNVGEWAVMFCVLRYDIQIEGVGVSSSPHESCRRSECPLPRHPW